VRDQAHDQEQSRDRPDSSYLLGRLSNIGSVGTRFSLVNCYMDWLKLNAAGAGANLALGNRTL
jgi:hypothetical protein